MSALTQHSPDFHGFGLVEFQEKLGDTTNVGVRGDSTIPLQNKVVVPVVDSGIEKPDQLPCLHVD
jgi:hypothetical protein